MRPSTRNDDGSAVVDFVLVSVLLVFLLLAVLQVAVYLHVRNVVAASAAEGARYGANADVDASAAAPRTKEIVGASVGRRTASRLACDAEEVGGAGGAVLVTVQCRGRLPVFFAPVGAFLPLDVTGTAVEEAP